MTKILAAGALIAMLAWIVPLHTACGKQPSIDSLQRALQQSADDTARVNVLAALAVAAEAGGHFEQALDYSRQMRKNALRLNFAKGVGRSWLLSGGAYHKKNEYDSALANLHHALAVFSAINDSYHQAATHLAIGQAHEYRGRYDESMEQYRKVLTLTTGSTYYLLIARTLNSMGNTSFNKGSYEVALNYYLQSYNTARHHKVSFMAPVNNLGVIYALLSQFDEALKYFSQYYEFIRQNKNATGKGEHASILLNIGECQHKLGRHTSAIDILQQAVELQREMNDRRGLALSYSTLGDICRVTGRSQEAVQHYESAIALAREIKNEEVLLHPLTGIATLWISLGRAREATASANEARLLSERLQTKHWTEKAWLLVARADSLKGDHRSAARWLSRYIQLHDSLFSEQKSKLVIRMRELYETEKKESEIKLLSEARKFEELKRSSERNIFMVTLSFLALAIAGAVYWAIMKTKHSRMLKTRNDTIAAAHAATSELLQKIEQQNKALAAKNEILQELHREKDGLIGVVAHDLRSPLQRIEGLSNLLKHLGPLVAEQEQVVDNIKKVCRDGSGLIRDLLDINQYETVKTLDLRDTEITHFLAGVLDRYLEWIRNKQLVLHYDYDKAHRAIMHTDRECLIRVIDNLLTNAIKFSQPHRNIYLKVVFAAEDKVKIILRDEGPGFHPDDLPHLFKKFKKLTARPTAGESSSGLGLSIVKSLVERLKGEINLINYPGKGAEFVLTFNAIVCDADSTLVQSMAHEGITYN